MEIKTIQKAIENQKERRALAISRSILFTKTYLQHYLKSQTPKFHKEIYDILDDDAHKFVELIAFRGSAKSTITDLAYPLYCAVTGKRKFIVIISDSFPQAKLHITNIIAELENNDWLKKDFGPFQGKEEWTATNVVLANGVRILSKSRGQKMRGLRHLQYRPDLIICDDVENNEVVRTKEQRDKTAEWFLSEVLPSLETSDGKLILVGNLLHKDSLMARQKELIIKEGIGVLKEYPLVKNGKSIWPERFNKETIAKLKVQVGTRFYQREYLLKLIPEEGQIITEELIQYYKKVHKFIAIGIGVDLAISQKQTADYTAINTIGQTESGKFYNLRSQAGRWKMNETLEKVHQTYEDFKNAYPYLPVHLGIEDVAYQAAAIDEYERIYFMRPESVKRAIDKRSRLQALEPYFERKEVFFRPKRDDDVVMEIVGFGIEQHDDRMDAFEISLNLLLTQVEPEVLLL